MPKNKISDEDLAVFREAMKHVKPLKKSDKVELKTPRPVKRRLLTQSTIKKNSC